MEYGRTWWGEKWLNSLDDVYFSNRLPRGKTYANNGKVINIKIKDNIVTAKVKGRYVDFYKTKLRFNKLSEKQQKIIKSIIYENPSIISSLLNNQLPPQLHEKLIEKGINVFPSAWDSFESTCDCPDYAPICKHIAALMYMLSLEIDKDPFQVFKLHNCHIEDLIDSQRKETQIKQIDEILKEKPLTKKYQTKLENIDFSNIPNTRNNILFLLEEKPVFSQKNFKQILKKFYTSSTKFSKKIQKDTGIQYKTYNDIIYLTDTVKQYEGEKEDLGNWINKTFLEKWRQPQKWEKLEIRLNNNYQLTNINTGKKSKLFQEHTEYKLFAFLTEINYTDLNKFNEQIQYLKAIYQFTLELIEKNSIIPEFFQLNNKEYKIRWIPTLFNEKVNTICEKLATTLPKGIIKYKTRNLTGKQAVITIISIIIEGFLKHYLNYGLTSELKKHILEPAFRLFFIESQKFDTYDTRNNENLINQWLSKFSLEKRDYKIGRAHV